MGEERNGRGGSAVEGLEEVEIEMRGSLAPEGTSRSFCAEA